MRVKNAVGVTVGGKHYTGYEATQKQRELERGMRALRRRAMTARATGDEKGLQELEAKLAVRQQDYLRFSKAAGLRTQEERLHTTGWGRKDGAGVQTMTRKWNSFDKLSGIETSKGLTVSSASIHLRDQALHRGFTVDGVREALTNPLHVDSVRVDDNGSSVRYIGREVTVNINPETGKITTGWPTGRKDRRKYGDE